MPQGAGLPATRSCAVSSGRSAAQRRGCPFRCLTRRLQIPPLLLLGVTCHALGSLVQPGLEGGASLAHLSRNRSNLEQDYCDTEARIASSLDFWTLSSENLLGIWWHVGAAMLTSGCVSSTRGRAELCEIVYYLVVLNLLVASPGDTGERAGLVPDTG